VNAKRVAGLGWILPETSCFPTSSDQQKLAGSHFQLFSSSLLLAFSHLRFSLKLLSALLETTNLFGF
jgi:hypothetical protein